MYFYLTWLCYVLNGESYVIVFRNINSVLFEMDSVPVALTVMVLLITVTGSYLGIFFSRSQVF